MKNKFGYLKEFYRGPIDHYLRIFYRIFQWTFKAIDPDFKKIVEDHQTMKSNEISSSVLKKNFIFEVLCGERTLWLVLLLLMNNNFHKWKSIIQCMRYFLNITHVKKSLPKEDRQKSYKICHDFSRIIWIRVLVFSFRGGNT